MNRSKVADGWIEENRLFIGNWTTTALKRFWADPSVRTPRTVAERQNGLEPWLERFRFKMRSDFEEEFRHQFASMAARLPESYMSEVFDQNVWPQIKPDVQRYAIHGLAAAWIAGNLGDATTLGMPEYVKGQWHIPIGIRGYGDRLGEIVLTQDGDVLENMTTSRKQLVEAARGENVQAVAAAAR